MDIPSVSPTHINGINHVAQPTIPSDIDCGGDRYTEKLKAYAKSLPYSIESKSSMMEMLDFILMRITQCIEAKDFDVGLLQWDSMLNYWSTLNYPIPKDRRIKLAKIYFHLVATPGISTQMVATCADGFRTLTRSKRKLSIEDMRLPWRPLYDILSQDLFLTRRQFEYTQLSWCMAYMADNARRFFHPAAIAEMLSTFLPQMDGSKLDSILSTHFYLTTFLPLSHPQSYLPMLFRTWESINSYKYDERMLQFLSRLAEMHVAAELSDPRLIATIPDDEISPEEGRPTWLHEEFPEHELWPGLYKDVGIFTEHEWNFLMCKCLASMEIPLADSGSLSTGPSADSSVGFELGRLPKPAWRISSLARIIVYSMAEDGPTVPASTAPTPALTPLASGMSTPQINSTSAGDYLSAGLGKRVFGQPKPYLAGSKALDSLARLIASTESFFHPSNSGAWTADLTAFIKYIAYDFNKRWHEEQLPTCKTPMSRRLTKAMRRELVKLLRTPALLAMFSQDPTTVVNVQSCMKSMSVMEPDLILHPILERAGPSLETLIETQRTIAIIKALGAVAPALTSREVYYPGAKYLVPILQLLIPGIDLNDPSKTLCTTSFLVEVSQYIQFGDLTSVEGSELSESDLATSPFAKFSLSLLANALESSKDESDAKLSRQEEDALLRDSTGSFPDWIASFLRRVIQLLENLPEEGPGGNAGGASEVQVIDAVAGAFSQICVHLSDDLFDFVLNMVYDYASNNVRSNAVRAIHQLVECVTNANPDKTLAKFLPFCSNNIRVELENGASSTRTTSASSPLPSDATLHWNLAILRGTVYNDGRAVLPYKDELKSLLILLHDKTFSKRGYAWSGKLLYSMLLTLTHTYPLENKFVNPDEWKSEEFRRNHHRYWGKLYKPDEVQISWHVPNRDEIEFAHEIFRDVVEPTLTTLEALLEPGVTRDAIWRNEFCRHLTFVREAFSGIPTLTKEVVSPEDINNMRMTSDILDEIPEMIAAVEPINSGFCLTDPADSQYQYFRSLRSRFGTFLHNASVSLCQQGEENTVDAVDMLISAFRSYLLDYGDSRDSYFVNEEHYTSDINVARQYAGQKEWPRAVYVRRARYYHSARLRWNSIERLRRPLEDSLIDDLVQWSMWHYPVIRESSQSLLENISGLYDGVRRRALPSLYKALEPSSDDDSMKGALWTLNSPSFARYAIAEPSLAPQLIGNLLRCQHNEKPSIQNCVSTVAENCLNSFVEPSLIIAQVPTPSLDGAVADLQADLKIDAVEIKVTRRCSSNVMERRQQINEAVKKACETIIEVGKSPQTHWRYAIFAIRCLRTLARRDVPLAPEHLRYFLERVYDNHPSIRYYAQRSVMKSLRNIKLRTYSLNPTDLALAINHNPLKVEVRVKPTPQLTAHFLSDYRYRLKDASPEKPTYLDHNPPGWLVWPDSVSMYLAPSDEKSTFEPWEKPSEATIAVLRELTTSPSYWEKLTVHLAEENHEEVVTQDNISCIKSIFQVLEDEPFEALRPSVEKLIANKDQNKQRAAAEYLAGLIGGSKHWPTSKQAKLWHWIDSFLPGIFGSNLKTDTVMVWTSFLEYVFYNKDPRRVQPLVDYLMDKFQSLDYNGEMSFDAVKILSLFRAFYEQMGLKFSAWTDDVVQKCWDEIYSEHEDVRAYLGEFLVFAENIKWHPKPSLPTTEVFVKECRVVPMDFDIMGLRGTYHKKHMLELVGRFQGWRGERIAGVRAHQSTYDRMGIAVCKWLHQALHDVHAISTFDYILPIMPEIFRFTEVSDNNELVTRASMLLVRMCGVTPPLSLVNPILDAIFEAIQSSPSWRVRLKALPLVQVFYFRQVPLIKEYKIVEMLEVLCKCLDDEVVEVREMAAITLSGILRLSPRRSVLTLKDRFVRLSKNTHIPPRQAEDYNKAVRQRHAAILGICALVDSYPYTVEKWMPDLLTNVLAEHTYDPIPISTTVRKCAMNFKRTHQDTWHEDSKRFNEDQLAALSTLLTGSSYYA